MAIRSKPVHYLQYDKCWGGIMFSNHGDKKQTIASSGCGAASSAMVLATLRDAKITPADVAKVILSAGYRTYNMGVDWGWFPHMASLYRLKYKQSWSTDDAIQALKEGALIVASMGPGYFTSFGHYILLWGLDEAAKQILCNDPNSTVRTKASYDLFKREGKNYFIFWGDDAMAGKPTWKDQIIADAKSAGLITSDHDPDRGAEVWFVLAVTLNALKEAKK